MHVLALAGSMTSRGTSSSTYRCRVTSQPVTVSTDDAGEDEHEHPGVAAGGAAQDADQQRAGAGDQVAPALRVAVDSAAVVSGVRARRPISVSTIGEASPMATRRAGSSRARARVSGATHRPSQPTA